MFSLMQFLSRYIIFQEPDDTHPFILKENPTETITGLRPEDPQANNSDNSPVDLPHPQEISPTEEKDQLSKMEISTSLEDNLNFIKEKFNVPINGDVIIKEFDITLKDTILPAFIFFYDGTTDREIMDEEILKPLMVLSNFESNDNGEEIAAFIRKSLVPHNQFNEVKDYKKVIDEVNFGGCGIFIEGLSSAFIADVKGFGHRSVGRPEIETVIRGPQEAFTETLRTNTALIRKRLKDEDLIVESISIGARSQTPCALLYIKDIANDSLVKEVRRRMRSISVDYLHDSGELEQFIEDSSYIPTPQMNSTERPDRTAMMLTEGKVAVIVNGSPFALVMPTSLHELIHSAEDIYLRFPYANFIRFIRIIGIIASLLLPALYISIINYHQEMIPTSLLLAIEASREKVPFPSIIEILIMEISFELVREAGIRVPGPIGPALGIVSGLIVGQAAITANIVSPVLVIVVAFTGIGSFTYPNFSMAFAIRLSRFFYIFLGAAAGFLGIAFGLFMQGLWLVSAKSFGVPFLVPYGPKTHPAYNGVVYKAPIWAQERRPDYVNPKDTKRQPKISRGWFDQEHGDDEHDSE